MIEHLHSLHFVEHRIESVVVGKAARLHGLLHPARQYQSDERAEQLAVKRLPRRHRGREAVKALLDIAERLLDTVLVAVEAVDLGARQGSVVRKHRKPARAGQLVGDSLLVCHPAAALPCEVLGVEVLVRVKARVSLQLPMQQGKCDMQGLGFLAFPLRGEEVQEGALVGLRDGAE